MQSDTSTQDKPKKKRWTVDAFIAGFYLDTLGKKRTEGNYRVEGQEPQALVYYAQGEGYGRTWNTLTQRNETEVMHETIAVKLPGGLVISNANRLRYCGSHMAWGRRTRGRNRQAPAQIQLEKLGAMPVPFSVFEQAKLNIRDVRVIEKAPSETVTIAVTVYDENKRAHVPKDEDRHYVGASLLEVNGSYFLFDIDREELKHKIFNPFVVKLPREAKTVAEAYDILIPEAVKYSIENKLRWERQGEWFFVHRYDELPALPPVPQALQIQVDNPPHVKDFNGEATHGYVAGKTWRYHFADKVDQARYAEAVKAYHEALDLVRDYAPHEGQLQQGNSRPNSVEKYIKHEGMVLCSGKISHTGREHRDLMLTGWYEAIPNTAVGSWQVSGEID